MKTLIAIFFVYASLFGFEDVWPEDAPNLTGAYTATVLSVHDGDTVKVDIDLGFDLRRTVAIRMVGVYAPELGKPGGDAATTKLKELIPAGSRVIVRPLMTANATPPHEIMSFQRYVARIWFRDVDVCQAMADYLTPPKTP